MKKLLKLFVDAKAFVSRHPMVSGYALGASTLNEYSVDGAVWLFKFLVEKI